MFKEYLRIEEINLHSLAINFIKNFWIAIVLSISAVLCFSAFSKLTYEPKYTSQATFMVSAKDSTSAYNSLTTTQNMASVFSEIFKSDILIKKIEERTENKKFDGVINTEIIPETNLLSVSVTSSSPESAFKGMLTIVENYNSISDFLFANARLEVIKDPIVPILPSNPIDNNRAFDIIFLLALFSSSALIIFICSARDTVQTPKSARSKIDARLLRTIHHEQRNKTLRSKLRKKNGAPLITNSLISKRFIEDNLSLCSAVEYHMRKRNQKVIMVTSAGENEGKSTVTANLALSLASKDKKILLLDCDFRKPSLHKILENPVPRHKSFSDFLLFDKEDPSDNLTYIKKHNLTLGVSFANHSNITALINNGKLASLIEKMREEMDYIIIDTPPMLAVADAEAISRMADTSLVVVRTDFIYTTAINDCLDNLRKSAPEVVGIVLNNYYKTLFQ